MSWPGAIARLIVPALASGALCAATTAATATFSTGDARVDRLVSQMTLEEKISLIHGTPEPAATDQGQAGYWAGLPRLGIPPMRLTDGPPGVLTRAASTGMPATMALAATFSRQDARANGVVIGRDARALGQQIVLEPFINLFRDQTFVRAYNTFGEDPFLTGQIAAEQIRGTQSQGVMAQAKHYVAYDGANDALVDPQTLRELYVAPFVAAIDAGVSSIMCSYNKINDVYACGNDDTLKQILRTELGFKGFVTSDWGATHDSAFINNGLDLEMPGVTALSLLPTYFAAGASALPGDMLAAVRNRQVSEANISRAVGRILLQMDRFGYLDHPPSLAITAEATTANAPIIRKTAEDAAVLLKNDGVLPLSARELHSLALIGPGAGQTIAVGTSGEKALGHVERQTGTYQALQQLLPDRGRDIRYAVANDMTGVPVPSAQLTHGGRPGLRRDDGRVDSELNFTRSNGNALAPGATHQWTGTLSVPRKGRYAINLQLLGALGSFSIDGRQVGATTSLVLHGNVLQPGEDAVLPSTDALDNVHRLIDLSAGAHTLSVNINADRSGNPVQVRLAWSTPAQQQADRTAAISAARAAGTAIVFAWSRGQPTFSLPADQDQLIRDIAAVNRNTIVVLNISQPIAMPWLSQVKAVLQMWYPGDEGGWATADVLLGRISPAGRLPFTWPVRLADSVADDPHHPERTSVGVNGSTRYSEGIFIGYRWFDQQQIAPRFAFGFGLSYTHFEYSGLHVSKAAGGGLDVNFGLRNRGNVAGDEVAQIYLGAPSVPDPGAQFAVRALVGFERVSLKAGERRSITVHVPLRQLQYWNTGRHGWMLSDSARPIYVGASSRDLRLTGTAPR